MIICHCQNITHDDIDAAINWMRAADRETVITPGKIYRALGKSPDCGGCMPLFLSHMRKNANCEVPAILRGMNPASSKGIEDERRYEGY
ncbi:BFD-like [2Fe-2S] binding domain protein [Pseudoruegeria aquimaris]|uniref:BFD-like [2Fe-2S] binding domain protein n=1 Tax=Pseudoruegeria aquimaris TaxID=393663 RepID=A0A1Y5SZF1_9RHOB|nr:(2Fe-2S)-binding protein [Pseudoruegeria aquimaris]SLN52469.1 BFD-like [2Fe-2S] binding domain protein [Pseudoruegeria aquimaris]